MRGGKVGAEYDWSLWVNALNDEHLLGEETAIKQQLEELKS